MKARVFVGEEIPYRDLMESAFRAALFGDLEERIGKGRAWLKIKTLKVMPGNRDQKAEMVLSLRGKDYWFPLSKRVFEKFKSIARTVSRGAGLKYLQKYIRAHRGYREVWFGKVPANSYYWKNRVRDWNIPAKARELTGNQALRRDFNPKSRKFAWQRKAESMAEAKKPAEPHLPLVIAPKVGLDVQQVYKIIDMLKSGSGYEAIAKKLGVSARQAEWIKDMMQEFGGDVPVHEAVEQAIARVEEGVESERVAAGLTCVLPK